MVFEPVNLQSELIQQQKKSAYTLDELRDVLKKATQGDSAILLRLNELPQNSDEAFDVELLEKNRIFSLNTLHEICIQYRLRFLDSTHFKADFPYEAIYQIKNFEKQHQVKIKHFKILAPCTMFQLQDANEDPLLFAQLSDNEFYLIHKWGNDLKWYRSLVNFPLRSIYTFFLSTILLAAIVALSFPFDWLNVNKDSELLFRFWLTTHFTIAFFFFFLFLGSLSQANFSDSDWNSKYFNQ